MVIQIDLKIYWDFKFKPVVLHNPTNKQNGKQIVMKIIPPWQRYNYQTKLMCYFEVTGVEAVAAIVVTTTIVLEACCVTFHSGIK